MTGVICVALPVPRRGSKILSIFFYLTDQIYIFKNAFVKFLRKTVFVRHLLKHQLSISLTRIIKAAQYLPIALELTFQFR